MNIESTCNSQRANVIEPTDSKFYLSDLQLNPNCPSVNQHILKAKEGQIFNISEMNINIGDNGHSSYGTLKDKANDRRVFIGNGPRENHLLISSSNEVELTVSSNSDSFNRFLLRIEGKLRQKKYIALIRVS